MKPLALLLALTLAGCPAGPKVAPVPSPKASKAPVTKLAGTTRVVAGKTVKRSLGGLVTLLANTKAAIVSDQGGGIISDNSGGIISDNSGGLISDKGGAYALLAALPESKLANAPIQVADAAGRTLVDAAGKPLGGKADGQGRYRLDLDLPDEPLVVRVPLSTGGALEAFLLAGTEKAPLDLGTASTVGARYVLDTYIQDQPDRLGKLPAAEADALTRAAAAALDLAGAGTPSYKPAEMTALGGTIRTQAPAFDRQLQRIEALLLGQARLGTGRPALQVPLVKPGKPVVEPDGSLLFPETGRLRRIRPDGTLETFADARFGTVKQNFPRIKNVQRGPDGTVYVRTLEQVFAIAPDLAVRIVIGPGATGTLPDGTRLADYKSGGMAVAPNGTLHVLGAPTAGTTGAPDRRFTFAPGQAPAVELAAAPVLGFHSGSMLARDDGTLDFTVDPNVGGAEPRRALQWKHGQAPVEQGPAPGDLGCEAPDGTRYYDHEGVITAVAPGGAPHTVVGPDVPAAPIAAAGPALGPDGTLYFDDLEAGAIWALPPGGAPKRLGGYAGLLQVGATTDVAANEPIGVAFQPDGGLLVAEGGNGHVVRFDGARYETIAGSKLGYAGDGGPALAARLGDLYAFTLAAGTLYVAHDDGIRAIDPAGIIQTIAGLTGGRNSTVQVEATTPLPAQGTPWRQLGGLAVGPDGSLYLASPVSHQLIRLSPDRKTATLVAGRPGTPGVAPDDLPAGSPARETALIAPGPLAFDPQGRLHVVDTGAFTVYRVDGAATDAPTLTRVAGIGFGATVNAEADQAGATPLDHLLAVPSGLAFGPDGAMYVAESGTANLSQLTAKGVDSSAIVTDLGLPEVAPRVRRFGPDGKVTVVAGPGGAFFADPTAEDALANPRGLALAADGRLAIADPGANLIRILPAGSF